VRAQKDNFHNPILGIDKRLAFGIVNSTTLSKLSFSEEGGGGRKTFKISSEITVSFRKSGSISLSDL